MNKLNIFLRPWLTPVYIKGCGGQYNYCFDATKNVHIQTHENVCDRSWDCIQIKINCEGQRTSLVWWTVNPIRIPLKPLRPSQNYSIKGLMVRLLLFHKTLISHSVDVCFSERVWKTLLTLRWISQGRVKLEKTVMFQRILRIFFYL